MAEHVIRVDLKNDLCSEGCVYDRPRTGAPFIREKLLPSMRECGYGVAEIIPDDRATEPSTKTSSCTPGG